MVGLKDLCKDTWATLVFVRGMTHAIRMCRAEVVMPMKAFFENLARHQKKSVHVRLDVDMTDK